MNILHVCSIKGRGGTGYMASRLCRFLHEAGHTVLVGACAGSKVEERARDAALPLLDGLQLRRGFRPLSLWSDVCRIRRCIRESSIQIVHAWHSIEYWTCALACLGTPARLARTRGLVTPQRAHVFNRLIHRRTAVLFATCKGIRQNYERAGFSTDNVVLLRDGVDVSRFSPELDRQPVRGELHLTPETMLIASIGRLEPVKNQTILLDGLNRLPPHVHAVLAGDGSQRAALEAQAEQLGLTERVHFLGVRRDIEAILAAADIYVLCSNGSEGSSRATLEAMAMAKPCVTTMVGMLPDIVKPGRTGLLFDHNNPDSLVECLENLIHDKRMRERLGSSACDLVRSEHAEAVMVQDVIDAYERALA